MPPIHTISVHTDPLYEVRLFPKDASPCATVAEELREFFAGKQDPSSASLPRLFVVTDENVQALYGESLQRALAAAGFETKRLICPPGEEAKSIHWLEQGLESLAQAAFTRRDVLVALGGGVIGDLTGYLAASYLRGVGYVQVPTTLLAMVDSSVGGKTAINLKAGKNLAGAFHQPSLVIIHEGFLDSLPHTSLLDGLAEAIKCGCIGDESLLSFLEETVQAASGDRAETGVKKTALREVLLTSTALTHIISSAIRLKCHLVEEDEHDSAARQLLNFGHTLGHAIEGASGFTISHGHAVASGMYLCTRASYLMGWSRAGDSDRLGTLLKRLGYTLVYPYSGDQLYEYALRDKKRQADMLSLVVPTSLGACTLRQIPIRDLRPFIAAALS